MERKWTKLDENKFSLTVDEKKVGEMHISTGSTSMQATCKIGNEDFTIQRTGFWKSTVEILDDKGKLVAKTYNEKWYANSSILEFGNKKYKLILHNNPMAEYAIMDEGKTMLSYGLNAESGKITVKINVAQVDSNLLFDFLLWYLFVPIVSENTGDNFLFQLMLTAQ